MGFLIRSAFWLSLVLLLIPFGTGAGDLVGPIQAFSAAREAVGDITATTDETSLLVISEAAIVEGGLTADHVIINGTVRGPVHARELLELQPKARIEGDVSYVALEMHQGAVISGQLRPLMVNAAEGEEKPLLKLAAKNA